MPLGTVTTREVNNKATGIDVCITKHNVIPGRLGKVLEYEVVVISNLSCFKAEKLDPDDVVQFMVPRKLPDFEKLRASLDKHYSSSVLPSVPKKSLFMNDADVRDSHTQLNELLMHIAKSVKLSSATEFLEFLGAKSPDGILKENKITRGTNVKARKPQPQKSQNLFDEYTDDTGLFDNEIKEDNADTTENDDPFLFNVAAREDLSKAEVSLFSTQDLGETVTIDDDLILPSARVTGVRGEEVRGHVDTEVDDLLNIQDDLAKFEVTPRPKPIVTEKPPITQKPPIIQKPKITPTDVKKPIPAKRLSKQLSNPPTSPPTNQSTTDSTNEPLSNQDIFNYINQQSTNEEVDLFS